MSDEKPLMSFVEMAMADDADRLRAELRLLDGLLARAVNDGKWSEALRIYNEGCRKVRAAGITLRKDNPS